ncbi:hypothetical protein K2173_013436 [Erythroxylum novogranatense]|uniref:t-SNARE coiled-coil homology domain-containing protein n=1 Tax=Erythroxylum novogranatense TaxID=1862640 RepID=A0AAV8SAE5_9ROSI|nr:hypothetical protein K2173_013436 [Erythroxylum novogranatense]
MTVIDLITRADAICKKYDKYDVDKQKELNVSGDDAFARLYATFEANLETAVQKSESAAKETKRATVVALNAEIRRIKGRLLEELPKLQRLALKKVKGLSKEELGARTELVYALKDRIEAVPDGSTSAASQPGASGSGPSASSYTGIKFDSNYESSFDNDYFKQTDETDQFRQEYEMRRIKQDEGLDTIAEGLDTLKNMARDMNEELDRQVPLTDEIDDKVDRATSDLKNTNVRLKDTVNQVITFLFSCENSDHIIHLHLFSCPLLSFGCDWTLFQLRSSRNFCIDITLLCIVLGIAAYLYNVLK